MVEKIYKRILNENINPRELNPYFQEVQKTKKTNISCKIQNQEKKLLEKFFKNNGKTNQEGYEEILLNYIDSLCFELKYFQFFFVFCCESTKIDSNRQLKELGFIDNYKNIEENIENVYSSIPPLNYQYLTLWESLEKSNTMLKQLKFENNFHKLKNFDKDSKEYPYMFRIQLNNILDQEVNGILKESKISKNNEHRGLGIVDNLEDNNRFGIEYTWKFWNEWDYYKVKITSLNIITYEKLMKEPLYTKKINKISNALLKSEIKYDKLTVKELEKRSIEELEKQNIKFRKMIKFYEDILENSEIVLKEKKQFIGTSQNIN